MFQVAAKPPSICFRSRRKKTKIRPSSICNLLAKIQTCDLTQPHERLDREPAKNLDLAQEWRPTLPPTDKGENCADYNPLI